MEVLQIINNFVRNGAQSISLPVVGDVPDCCLSVIFPAIYEIWSLEWCIFRSWNQKFQFNATFSSSVEYGVHLQMAYTNALPYFTHFLNVKHLWDSAHHQLASYIHLTEMIPHYFLHFFFNNICTLNSSSDKRTGDNCKIRDCLWDLFLQCWPELFTCLSWWPFWVEALSVKDSHLLVLHSTEQTLSTCISSFFIIVLT